MNPRRQALLRGYLPAQTRKGFALLNAQGRTKAGFVFSGEPAKLFHHLISGFRNNQFGVAAVFLAASAFDQSFFHQFINQHNHTAGQHAEMRSQRPLVAGRRGGDDSQNARLRRGEAQNGGPLTETISRVGAKLGQQEGRAPAGRDGGLAGFIILGACILTPFLV